MNYSEIQKVFDRANRFRGRLKSKEGKGASWSYTFEDGETHEYQVNGVKPPEDIEDEIQSALIRIWSLKDCVKKHSVLNGKERNWIEKKINSDKSLCILADIANGLKHGGLDRKQRSNSSPKLGPVRYITIEIQWEV